MVSEHDDWSRVSEGEMRSEMLAAKDEPKVFCPNKWKDEVAIKLGWGRGFKGRPGAESWAGAEMPNRHSSGGVGGGS